MTPITRWHRNLITRVQRRLGLSDYQLLWISFLKGLALGALVALPLGYRFGVFITEDRHLDAGCGLNPASGRLECPLR
jgi:hypothetical protein